MSVDITGATPAGRCGSLLATRTGRLTLRPALAPDYGDRNAQPGAALRGVEEATSMYGRGCYTKASTQEPYAVAMARSSSFR